MNQDEQVSNKLDEEVSVTLTVREWIVIWCELGQYELSTVGQGVLQGAQDKLQKAIGVQLAEHLGINIRLSS